MKLFLINVFLFSILFTGANFPQDYYKGTNLFSLRIAPVIETWNIKSSRSFSEFTNTISLGYYPSHNTSLTFNTKYANVGGDLNNLNGFSDSQIALIHNLSKYNLTLTLGINIPSGRTKLSQTQFETERYISQDLFGLKTPNFGQGTNIILGASWIHQLSENYVAGLGISYQIKTEYQPLSGFPDKYKPSNEISVTGGTDIKLSNTQTLTADIMSVFYGNDKVNGNDIFSSGSRTVFDLVYRQYFGFNELSAVMLYSIVSEKYYNNNIFSYNAASAIESTKLNPNKFYIGLNFNQWFTPLFSFNYGVFTSIYENTALFFSNYTIFGVNLSPNFKISSSVNVPVIIRYSMGSAPGKPGLQGLTFGTGINFLF